MELAELTREQIEQWRVVLDNSYAKLEKDAPDDITKLRMSVARHHLNMLCDLALRSLQAAMPEEPTDAMYWAGVDYLKDRGTAWCVIDLYKAMYRAHAQGKVSDV